MLMNFSMRSVGIQMASLDGSKAYSGESFVISGTWVRSFILSCCLSDMIHLLYFLCPQMLSFFLSNLFPYTFVLLQAINGYFCNISDLELVNPLRPFVGFFTYVLNKQDFLIACIWRKTLLLMKV